MGVTTGSLTDVEQQVITITVPGTLTRAQADQLAAALNCVIAQFNAAHPGGSPRLVAS